MYVACEPQEMVGFGIDASSSMTFSALLNLGNQGGNITTGYGAVFKPV